MKPRSIVALLIRRTSPVISALLTIFIAVPLAAHAQHTGAFGISANPANNAAYFASANYTVNTDISDNGFKHDVFVGKSDTNTPVTNFLTQTPQMPVTLTVTAGAYISHNGTSPNYPDGNTYAGVTVWGNNAAVVSGGQIGYGVDCHDTAAFSMSGGSVADLRTIGQSTANISGGTVQNGAYFLGNGSVPSTISGGSFPNGLAIDGGASVNFVGNNLSVTYGGTKNGQYGYADKFTVLGTFAGSPNQTYNVFLYNSTGTADAAPRRFTLNGATPVVAPEAGTFALLLPVLSLAGASAVRRARKIA